jgi:hypothetical protein
LEAVAQRAQLQLAAGADEHDKHEEAACRQSLSLKIACQSPPDIRFGVK